MTALFSLLADNPTIVAVLAGAFAALGWGVRQRLAGAAAERARQAASEAVSRAIANQIDNDIGALPAAETRKELRSWARD